MNKKTILILASVATVLILLVGAAIYVLYSGVEPEETASVPTPSHSALLRAVPSDAAAILCFSDVRKGTLFLTDPSGMFSPLFSRTKSRSFLSFLTKISEDGLHGAPMLLSLHFSGNLEPLLIVDAGRVGADTTALAAKLIRTADGCGLCSELVPSERQMLLISASDALIGSSRRHIEGGMSIMDNKSFLAVLGKAQGMNVMYFANDYAPQLVSTYMDRPFRKYSDFLKRFADWTAVSISSAADYHMVLKGGAVCGKSPSYYQHVLEGIRGADSQILDILPTGTLFSVTLSATDNKKFQPLFEKYLDASGKLPAHKKKLDSLTTAGSGPLQWHSASCIREVTKAEWKSGTKTYSALFIRTSDKVKGSQEIEKNIYNGYPATLFGSFFSLPDESYMLKTDVWTVIGGKDAISHWKECGRLNVSIPSTAFAACVVIPPVVMQWDGNEICVEAVATQEPEYSAMEVTTSTVEVSKGPFNVKNCATGKTNQFYQNEHLSLCLNDEDGRGLWGVSFDKPICGSVGMVDYFANDKIQFAFCAGSKLYLIDRLGRFVSGFPVSLESEVVLGPAVFDFSGLRKYNVMVLHKGNRIDMYNLKGVKPDGWKGICSQYTITALPELVKVDGKNYWKVATSGGLQAYDFLGGEPLKGKIERTVLK